MGQDSTSESPSYVRISPADAKAIGTPEQDKKLIMSRTKSQEMLHICDAVSLLVK
jgi:hypothetical protein